MRSRTLPVRVRDRLAEVFAESDRRACPVRIRCATAARGNRMFTPRPVPVAPDA